MSSATNHDAPPTDPIAAVTHPEPYRYYADLVANRPLYRDDALGLWIASDAAAVTAALTHDACRVRPPHEPVPAAIVGSPAGEIFRRLVRMNDGAGHCPFSDAVAATVASVTQSQVAQWGGRCASDLVDQLQPAHDIGRLGEFAFRLSPLVVGGLLGVPHDNLGQTAQWVGDFVRCVFPGSTPAQIERGKLAAGHLLDLFRDLYAHARSRADTGLLATLAREAERVGRPEPDVVIANGIGLLSQAYEATAGLIGNTLLALADRPELRVRFAADAGVRRDVTLEVARYDPPTHNTRRFLARHATIAGQAMQAGDTILVVLAAANRDPAANPEPDRFDPARKARRLYTFGAGKHACPGDGLAVAIAAAGVRHLIEVGLDFDRFAAPVTYRPSANVRIPVFR